MRVSPALSSLASNMLRRGISLKPRARKGGMTGLHGLHIRPATAMRAPFAAVEKPDSRCYSGGISPGAGGFRHAARRTQVLSHSDPSTGLPVGPRADRMSAPDFTSEQVLAAVLASVDDDKAEDIRADRSARPLGRG